jgi:hypothetical protein
MGVTKIDDLAAVLPWNRNQATRVDRTAYRRRRATPSQSAAPL